MPSLPSLITSAGAFLVGWLTSGIGALLVLVGRYGEVKDLFTIGNRSLAVPRRAIIYAMALAFFVVGPFVAFHREMVRHWEDVETLVKNSTGEQTRLKARIANLEEINETIRTQRDQALGLVESIRESASKDFSVLQDHYSSRFEDSKDAYSEIVRQLRDRRDDQVQGLRQAYDENVQRWLSAIEERDSLLKDQGRELANLSAKIAEPRWWVDYQKDSTVVYITPGQEAPGDFAFFIRARPDSQAETPRVLGILGRELEIERGADETGAEGFLIRSPDVSRHNLIEVALRSKGRSRRGGSIGVYFPTTPTLKLPMGSPFDTKETPTE